MDDRQLSKWNEWLGTEPGDKGSIYRDLIDFATIRHVIGEVQDIVRANPALNRPSVLYDVLALNYAHSAVMYIRRQVRSDGTGLCRLLLDLKKHHAEVTREWYVSRAADVQAGDDSESLRKRRLQLVDQEFTERFGGSPDHGCLNADVLQADLDALQRIYAASKDFVNSRVAHLVHPEPSSVPTYANLAAWAATLDELFKKYKILLQGSAPMRLRPAMTHDWRAVLREPWIPPDESA